MTATPLPRDPAEPRVDGDAAKSDATGGSQPASGTPDTARGSSDELDAKLDLGLRAAFAREVPAARVPESLGNYRLLGVLGRGGMGVVYEAEQQSPRRRVALKVIRPGAISPAVIARFRREVELLGRLEHPGIARIYEAGTFDEGAGPLPFLAMERIDGERLDRFVAEHALDTRARVELVARVADAVAHAHHKGVVHRDLKPSNVLVDASGEPKVLDFGVARALDSDGEATLETREGQVLGTLPYMSPEQLAGEPRHIDTRTDVYALGTILYELLAGRLPLTLGSAHLAEAARIVREVEPERLSRHKPEFAGDLETIVAHALEKDPARRYGSAGEFAADLRRFLADEPIQARPATAGYQLAKFARRHRAWVLGAAGVLVTLVLGLSGTLIYAFAAERARGEAELESARKTRTIGVLSDMLAASSPFARGPETRVVDLLDETARNVDREFADDPDVECAVRMVIASSYRELGLYERALEHAERAVELATRLGGSSDTRTLSAQHLEARLRLDLGHLERAEALAESVCRARTRLLGADHRDTLDTESVLLLVRSLARGRSETLPAFRALIERARRALGERDRLMLSLEAGFGDLLLDAREYVEAVEVAKHVVELSREVLGEANAHTLLREANYAAVLGDLGRFEEASALYARTLERARATLGSDHTFTAMVLASRARLASTNGALEEAEAAYREATDIYVRALGADHTATLVARNNLGVCLRRQGRFAEAEALLEDVLAARRRVLGEDHPDVAATLNALGSLYERTGQFERARDAFERALAIDLARFGPDDTDVLLDRRDLGVVLVRMGRPDEGEAALASVLPELRERMGAGTPQVRRTEDRLVVALEAQGCAVEALELRRRRLAEWTPSGAAEQAQHARARLELAQAEAAAGRSDVAREALEALFSEFLGRDADPELLDEVGAALAALRSASGL